MLGSQSNSRFRNHLKNAASALCARTLPKQRRNDVVSMTTRQHHTYPRVTQQKRAQIPCRLEPLLCAAELLKQEEAPCPIDNAKECHPIEKTHELRGVMAREVASVWGSHVGPPHKPAPADRVQGLFNDIDLYPTKTQVFEMLVCARQCVRRKSLTLTFGEFCVFAAELRQYSRQSRQGANTPESPQQSILKKYQEKAAKYFNGSEASSPSYEIFLGGSCNPTTWRSDIAIPMLKQLGITYFNPQVEDWSTELMEVEDRAKAAAQALLFVLDRETRAVAASVEAAHHATSPRDLLLVLRPYVRHQNIAQDTITDHEYLELSRARATLQELVERRGLPVFSDIRAALKCAHAVLRRARTHPRRQLGQTILRLKRAFDAAGSKSVVLPRGKAVDALRDVTKAPRDLAERCLPSAINNVDFETFCATVAEMSTEADFQIRNGQEANENTPAAEPRSGDIPARGEQNGLNSCNTRLRAYGRKLRLFIPTKSSRGADVSTDATSTAPTSGPASGGSTPDSVFTPGTERRLEQLPAMLGAPVNDVYLGGCFPCEGPRAEEMLSREGFSYSMPRPKDYTRMFSVPARRPAPAHPDSPRTDKKPRGSPPRDPNIQLRDKADSAPPEDRLSASDFYTVSEDVTPQPFKGTYDEDLILGSRVLLFSMCSNSPCFAGMVLAAHYMGLRPSSTVLLVQPMDPATTTNYSEAAVKDYNRGRHYLADLAQRSGVPVFNDTASAIQCVMSRLRHT